MHSPSPSSLRGSLHAGLLIFACLCHLAHAEDAAAPFRVVDGLFDFSNRQTLGLKTIPSEHIEVYHATDETGYGYRFSHHAGLGVFQGQLYCSWSSGQLHEDRPAQRIAYARSADGKTWSPPQVLAVPSGKMDRCIGAGFHVAKGTLVAGYTTTLGYPTNNLIGGERSFRPHLRRSHQ